jgi:hypothetical protein
MKASRSKVQNLNQFGKYGKAGATKDLVSWNPIKS